jgi:uncharacterized protein
MTTKDSILSILKQYKSELSKFGVSSVGLFGSYRNDLQTIESDIDLLTDFDPEKENFDNYMVVYDIFENIFKNERVEIVTKRRTEQTHWTKDIKPNNLCLKS